MNGTVLFLNDELVRSTRLVMEGIIAFAATRGWQVQRVTPPAHAGADYLSSLAEFWKPVGIVAMYAPDTGIPSPDAAPDIPFVCFDLDESRRPEPEHARRTRLGYVSCDSKSVAKMAARTLLEQGFASYAYVSAHTRFHWNETRREAFRAAIELNGGICHAYDGSGLSSSAAADMERLGAWLKSLPKPCGLLAAHDRAAASVLMAAAREGIDVPGELAVVGVDDDETLCESMSPQLTSVSNDFFKGGRLAGELIQKLAGPRLRQPPTACYGAEWLVTRLSTRRIVHPAPSVRLALEAIRRRAADGISAADILPVLGGSRRSAEKRFRAAVGKSILEEILDVRFERLLPLLRQPQIPLGSLADRTGFASENHLQRMFKARYGMTLSAYRKKETRQLMAGA